MREQKNNAGTEDWLMAGSAPFEASREPNPPYHAASTRSNYTQERLKRKSTWNSDVCAYAKTAAY